MIKIAFCDDCEEDRNEILRLLGKIECLWHEEFCIFPFSGGRELCESLKTQFYDIILLDILMDDLDGVETARKIRSMGVDSRIIFISSYDERLRDLFSVGTLGFVDKPIDIEILERAIKTAYQSILQDNERVFIYQKNKTKNFIPLKDIMYFESDKYQVAIHTTKSVIRYNESLKNIWSELKSNAEFIMPHKAFIVNLKYSSVQNSSTILVNNNLSISIGRVYKEEALQKYMEYLRRRRN